MLAGVSLPCVSRLRGNHRHRRHRLLFERRNGFASRVRPACSSIACGEIHERAGGSHASASGDSPPRALAFRLDVPNPRRLSSARAHETAPYQFPSFASLLLQALSNVRFRMFQGSALCVRVPKMSRRPPPRPSRHASYRPLLGSAFLLSLSRTEWHNFCILKRVAPPFTLLYLLNAEIGCRCCIALR